MEEWLGLRMWWSIYGRWRGFVCRDGWVMCSGLRCAVVEYLCLAEV